MDAESRARAASGRRRAGDKKKRAPPREPRRRTRRRPWEPTDWTASIKASRPALGWDRPPQQRAHFFLNIDDDLGFAQLFGEARVVLLQFLNFFLDGIALGLRARAFAEPGLGGCQPRARAAKSSTKTNTILRGEAVRRCRRSLWPGRLRQDALFVLSGEASALGLSYDLGVGVDLRFGAGFAASGTPVALASLGLPTRHRRQCRWRRRGDLMGVHASRNSFSPCSLIKERGVSQPCWHGGPLLYWSQSA